LVGSENRTYLIYFLCVYVIFALITESGKLIHI